MNILKAPASQKLREYTGVKVSVEQPDQVVGLILFVLTFIMPMFVLPFAYVMSRRFRAQDEKNALAELAFMLSLIFTLAGVVIAAVGLFIFAILPSMRG